VKSPSRPEFEKIEGAPHFLCANAAFIHNIYILETNGKLNHRSHSSAKEEERTLVIFDFEVYTLPPRQTARTSIDNATISASSGIHNSY
jgi:hypothetical protein